jgi:hypothetical protein
MNPPTVSPSCSRKARRSSPEPVTVNVAAAHDVVVRPLPLRDSDPMVAPFHVTVTLLLPVTLPGDGE